MPTGPRPKPRKVAGELDFTKFDFAFATPEKPAEREARLLRQAEDAAHERRKDFLLFIVSLCVVAGTAFCALVVLIVRPADSPWAAPLLTLIVGALLGYQTGKSRKPKDDA